MEVNKNKMNSMDSDKKNIMNKNNIKNNFKQKMKADKINLGISSLLGLFLVFSILISASSVSATVSGYVGNINIDPPIAYPGQETTFEFNVVYTGDENADYLEISAILPYVDEVTSIENSCHEWGLTCRNDTDKEGWKDGKFYKSIVDCYQSEWSNEVQPGMWCHFKIKGHIYNKTQICRDLEWDTRNFNVKLYSEPYNFWDWLFLFDTEDENGTFDISYTPFLVACPNLVLNKTSPGNITPNTLFDYTINITNDGTWNATEIRLEDPLPPQVSFVSYTDNCGFEYCNYTGRYIITTEQKSVINNTYNNTNQSAAGCTYLFTPQVPPNYIYNSTGGTANAYFLAMNMTITTKTTTKNNTNTTVNATDLKSGEVNSLKTTNSSTNTDNHVENVMVLAFYSSADTAYCPPRVSGAGSAFVDAYNNSVLILNASCQNINDVMQYVNATALGLPDNVSKWTCSQWIIAASNKTGRNLQQECNAQCAGTNNVSSLIGNYQNSTLTYPNSTVITSSGPKELFCYGKNLTIDQSCTLIIKVNATNITRCDPDFANIVMATDEQHMAILEDLSGCYDKCKGGNKYNCFVGCGNISGSCYNSCYSSSGFNVNCYNSQCGGGNIQAYYATDTDWQSIICPITIKKIAPAEVNIIEEFEYSIIVTASESMTGIVINDTLPSGTAYVNYSYTCPTCTTINCTYNDTTNLVSCGPFNMTPGTLTLKLKAKVNNSNLCGYPIKNCAELTATELSTVVTTCQEPATREDKECEWEFKYGICGCEAEDKEDLAECNKWNEGAVEGGYECVCHPYNESVYETKVNCPEISVYKTANSSCVIPNDKLGYTINIYNYGTASWKNSTLYIEDNVSCSLCLDTHYICPDGAKRYYANLNPGILPTGADQSPCPNTPKYSNLKCEFYGKDFGTGFFYFGGNIVCTADAVNLAPYQSITIGISGTVNPKVNKTDGTTGEVCDLADCRKDSNYAKATLNMSGIVVRTLSNSVFVNWAENANLKEQCCEEPQQGGLIVDKTANINYAYSGDYGTPGDSLTYTINISNTANETIANISIADTIVFDDSCIILPRTCEPACIQTNCGDLTKFDFSLDNSTSGQFVIASTKNFSLNPGTSCWVKIYAQISDNANCTCTCATDRASAEGTYVNSSNPVSDSDSIKTLIISDELWNNASCPNGPNCTQHNLDIMCCPCSGEPDINITKDYVLRDECPYCYLGIGNASLNQSFANPGQWITYTIKVTNTGEECAPLENIKVVDHLPSEVAYDTELIVTSDCFNPAYKYCKEYVGTLTCQGNPLTNPPGYNFTTLMPGESCTINITTKIRENVQQCENLTNVAKVFADYKNYKGTSWDHTQGNELTFLDDHKGQSGTLFEMTTSTVQAYCPEKPEYKLEANKTVDNTTKKNNDEVIFTVVVRNNENNTKYNVTLVDIMPQSPCGISHCEYVDISSIPSAFLGSCSCNPVTNILNCTLANLAPYQNATITIKKKVYNNYSLACENCTNTLIVNATNPDGEKVTYTSNATYIVKDANETCVPEQKKSCFSINKTSVPELSIMPDGYINYTIKVCNPCSDNLTNITMTDEFPSSIAWGLVSMVDPLPPVCNCTGTGIICAWAKIIPGECKVVSVRTKVRPEVVQGTLIKNCPNGTARNSTNALLYAGEPESCDYTCVGSDPSMCSGWFDLSISPADITIASTGVPANVSVSAQVHNPSNVAANGVDVELWMDGAYKETKNVNVNGLTGINVAFTTIMGVPEGSHNVTVKVNTNNAVLEWDYTNNKATKAFDVLPPVPPKNCSVSVNPTGVAANKTTNVTINVTDANNGSAIEGASVTLSNCGVSASGTTNSNGIATIEITATLAPCNISVTVTKTGYSGCSGTIAVTALLGDTNGDGKVDMNELLSFITEYLQDQHTMSDLLVVITNYLNS